MKTIKLLALLFISSLVFTSCSDSEDPIDVNEEELITSVNVTLTPDGGGTSIMLTSFDLDGADGPLSPVIMGGTLAANTTYNGSIELLNETEDPAEDITEEVGEDEADEHQFFYSTSGDLDATFTYSDSDENGDPIGVDFTVTTGDAGEGTFTFFLVHEPSKDASGVSGGDITNAGGAVELEVPFSITVE